MNQLMSNIKNIPGVVGVAVFKDDGVLVAFDFPEAYDIKLLNLIGVKFQPIKEILPEHEGEIVYLCWEFEDLLGFYYPVAGGWVNIISSDQIPMPVFSLTMTAVASKLPKLLEGTSQAQARAAGEAGEVAEQSRPAEAEPEPAVDEGTVEIITAEKIEELEKFFSSYLGPASPVIFKRVATHLGHKLDNIPADKLRPLIDGVTAKVPENKRDEAGEKVAPYINE
ncbi:MAG: hypothetical protein GY950_05150 [bacterium]|nr:hypothetical protein [bacterium]